MKRRTRKASEIQDLLLHLEHLRSEMLTLVNENRPIVSEVHPDKTGPARSICCITSRFAAMISGGCRNGSRRLDSRL